MKVGVGGKHQRWGQGAAAGSLLLWGSATQDAEGYGTGVQDAFISIGVQDAFISVGVQVQIQNNFAYCHSLLQLQVTNVTWWWLSR